MTDPHDAAQTFEGHRQHLLAVAYRLLGDQAQAEDIVQETWIRLSNSNLNSIHNLAAWSTTCVTRLCIDHLRHRLPVPTDMALEPPHPSDGTTPEHLALLAADVEAALNVVLDRLSPPQRVALVLHDVFGLSYASIATMLGNSEDTTRRQASRARARIRASDPDTASTTATSIAERARVVRAFQAAASTGDITALTALLHADVVRTADPQAVPDQTPLTLKGRDAVIAEAALMRANATQTNLAWRDGEPILTITRDNTLRLALIFTHKAGRITHYDVIADPDRLATLDTHLTREA